MLTIELHQELCALAHTLMHTRIIDTLVKRLYLAIAVGDYDHIIELLDKLDEPEMANKVRRAELHQRIRGQIENDLDNEMAPGA